MQRHKFSHREPGALTLFFFFFSTHPFDSSLSTVGSQLQLLPPYAYKFVTRFDPNPIYQEGGWQREIKR